MNQFTYNRPDVDRLVSQLRIKILPKYRKMSQPKGLEGRLRIMRLTVTALLKYERLELSFPQADEARGYAERLISEAIRHGDSHQPTMETAEFWLLEKQMIHKLFKVLVPRFENHQTSYTSIFKGPLIYPSPWRPVRSILELKGNPFPPLIFDSSRHKNMIHNVLLDEARKEYYKDKRAEVAKRVTQAENEQAKMSGETVINESMSKAAQDISEAEQLLKCVDLNDKPEDQLSGEEETPTELKRESEDGPVPIV